MQLTPAIVGNGVVAPPPGRVVVICAAVTFAHIVRIML